MATTDFNNRLITPELKEALAGYPPVFSGRKEEGCTLHRSILPWKYPLVHYGRSAGRQ